MTQSRRKFSRQPIQISALVHPAQGRSWLCAIKDFCEEGMLLSGAGGGRSLAATGAEAAVGDNVAVHFSVATPTGQEHYRTQATIARIMESGNALGVCFEEGLEQRAFKSLLDFAVAAGTAVPDELPEVEDDLSDIERLVAQENAASAGTPSVDQLANVGSATKSGSGKTAKQPGRGLRDSRIGKEDADRLKARIKTVTQRSASRIAAGYVQKACADLLVSARDAGTNAVQTRYLEALTVFEKNQQSFVESFVNSVVSGVDEISDLQEVLSRRRKRDSGNNQKLELVDTAQFEKWLLVAELISKLEGRLREPLIDMRAQFGLLAKPWSHKDVIPVGPAAFCWAFDDSQKSLVMHEDVRKEMYSLFSEALNTGLQNLYKALGTLFDDSGAMPALEELREAIQPKYTIRNRAGVTVTPQDYQQMDAATRDAVMAAEGLGPSRIDENPFIASVGGGAPAFNTARSILDISRRSQERLGRPRPTELADGQGKAFEATQITEALTTIQQELGDEPLTDEALKGRVVDLLRKQYGADKGLTEQDFDTLQVMEGLVSSLSTDQLITDGVREWVRRLEVTLNKVATQDQGFLASDPENPHSAVQLLNQLARLGNTKDTRVGIDREVGRRVDELLAKVIEDFDDNPQVLNEVVEEMHPLVDRQSKTYRGNVERTVKASEGQQKLARARSQVVEEITQRVGGREVPDLLVEMLNPGWRNLLVHTHLRNGAQSSQWRDQLAIVDQVFSQLSGDVVEDSPEWVDPERLLRRVVDGLNSISFDPAKRTPLIMKMSSALVGDTTGDKAQTKRRFVAADEVEQLLGLEGMLPDMDPTIESSDEGVRATFSRAVDRAKRIQVGEWLATSDSQGRPLILTVAFVGDGGSSFVLVNRKGVKTLERNLKEIAEELHQGRMTLLEDYDLPLMERASQRMLEDMHNQLAFQSTHDDLTQLMNRREFERMADIALKRVKSGGGQHGLIYLDLDQFKIINNTSGHHAGDELLKVLAESLSNLFNAENHTVARLGGDEFGVLLEDVESIEARELAEQGLQTIRSLKFAWEGKAYPATCSMGLVFVDPSTNSVEELMQHADEACFSAKDAGRNRLQEYELGDQRMMQRQGAMEWVTQLDQALADDRFILNCQKIVPIVPGDGSDYHYEILLTMIDELGDVVAPTELIYAAETYNRMTTIDRWVIENTLQWMADNRRILDEFGGFAINVSGHSVNDTTFPDFVLEQFAKTQAPTAKVTFEITETATIANLDNAVDFMNRMRIIGCRFSLDDFGTGLSSYSYLRNLPVDYVKIDGVFVKGIVDSPADHAVVRSINEI
ncbi:MAG: diguanylate cyclase (GGDEF)-like protein, partial [Candidatus Azotimanducaceae bacterium]